jgi:hypothetical protein
MNRNAAARATLVWLAALGCAGVTLAEARVARAQVSLSVDVTPPEVTIAEPEEVAATTEPPEPVYEEAPVAPAPGYVWVAGNWAWTGGDWAWYPGRWLVAPAGRVYVEPYYERIGGRVVYVHGYWGYPGAVHRSYGGDRIVFAAPPRPPEYRRGEYVRVERRPGAPPGARPAGFYQHATGPVRPMPRNSWPARAPEPAREVGPARVEAHGEVRGPARVEPVREAPRAQPPAAQAPRAAPAPQPHPAPAARPAPQNHGHR